MAANLNQTLNDVLTLLETENNPRVVFFLGIAAVRLQQAADMAMALTPQERRNKQRLGLGPEKHKERATERIRELGGIGG